MSEGYVAERGKNERKERETRNRGRLGVDRRTYTSGVSSFSSCLPPYTCPSVPSSQDSAIVVESFKSGFEPPGDFPFEDFSQNLSRTGLDGSISNTPKGDRDRDGVPGPRSDPKHPMSRTKNKLWLFGKKPKVQGLYDARCSFISMLHIYLIQQKCHRRGTTILIII